MPKTTFQIGNPTEGPVITVATDPRGYRATAEWRGASGRWEEQTSSPFPREFSAIMWAVQSVRKGERVKEVACNGA